MKPRGRKMETLRFVLDGVLCPRQRLMLAPGEEFESFRLRKS